MYFEVSNGQPGPAKDQLEFSLSIFLIELITHGFVRNIEQNETIIDATKYFAVFNNLTQ